MEYNYEGESLVNLASTATALAVIPLPHQVSIHNREAGILQSLWLHNLGLSKKAHF